MQRKQPVPDAYLEFGLASRRDQARPFDRFHRHNEVELLLVESGAASYLFSRGRETWRAGDLVLFWGAMPHQLVAAEPGTVSNWLTVPLTWFLDWKLPPAFAQAVLEGAVFVRAGASATVGEDLARFQRWHADLASREPERLRAVLLEAQACFLRMALAAAAETAQNSAAAAPLARRPPGADPGSLGAAPLTKVEAMTQFIARNYTRPLRVTEIAAAAQLNAEYATTLFRRACGRSLMAYVTEHRISHAQRLLATTDQKILDIAFEAGFQTPSRFYTAFEAACGCAPRAYRLRVQGSGG